LADFALVPIGTGTSISPVVAAVHDYLTTTKLKVTLHAHGTNLEGEWDELMNAIKHCQEIVHRMGAPVVESRLVIRTRTDRKQTTEDMVNSVRLKQRRLSSSDGNSGDSPTETV